MERTELVCCLTIEKLGGSGESLKKTVLKGANLMLGRNEFRDILLKINAGKYSQTFHLDNISVFKRFAVEGKACIKVPACKLQLLISNCPPNQLIHFLKSLCIKLDCGKLKKPISQRVRLVSELPRKFEEISPLNDKDIASVNAARAKREECKGSSTTPGTNKRKPLKRIRTNTKDSETDVDLVPKKKLHISVAPSCLLSKEQKCVLNAVLSGKNIFFTGSAGTGKSFLMKKIIGALPPDSTFATASTGVAACHIGGTTLHQFAGIGSGTQPLEKCIELASRPARKQTWRKCKHLIVDEISMIDGDFFTKLEAVARAVLKSQDPFGGIQVILCGDFLQLPPVVKPGEHRKFCFESPAWQRCIHLNYELKTIRRQNDPTFINILQQIRVGRCSESVTDRLMATSKQVVEQNGVQATRLCTHKEDVEQLNKIHLEKLNSESRFFDALDSDPQLCRHLDSQCPVGRKIELKIGAQVMLTKNIDVQRGLVNGARGVVKSFEPGQMGYPVVKLLHGTEETIRPERWTVKATAGILLTRRQLPLKLAWAISIHKSQGMSLDCVEISLSRVFECGQAYVALSRARSLQGLRVMDFESRCVRAHPRVLQFYRSMRRQQIVNQAYMEDYSENKENQRPLW
ncbi:ATP-dependent DNA helicase PIF1 [Holothuria leucospilota]|uniref:ATP-dependent DNA helicase PIF1 n=1 Tax=Holothuria leucospilota TaxID=206669 RepID=A0A9Q1C888_HOLLE|nr:ATP-dependent DNA helicase PIF1 [Holothuria leucospilota]